MAKLSTMLEHDGEVWQHNPLLATKLYIPSVQPKLLFRLHLIQRLNEGIDGKLTLICAPAGFGKTSLLSEWCAWHTTHTTGYGQVAWVSLDGSDNDPVRFWSYVLAALEQVHPGIEDTAPSLLQLPQPPSFHLIITTLINALLTFPEKIVLILDDYHTITDSSIHEGLSFLLDHLPPSLHLILASRSEPPLMLPRLRSRGHLTELRIDDLRFTLPQTVSFLKAVTGHIFPEETVAMLEQRTEGWVAGLHLAALSLKGRTDSTAFINAFAGSNRYILDYLSEEVLRRQPEGVQIFLLQTAILDRLSGPLCDAVTLEHNSQAILEHLEQANLFIMPLDDDRSWYRYHHLLTDVLRRQLQQSQPDLVPELHRRAAIWFEQRGFISEAVSHALAAVDHELAARMMEQAATSMLLRGERNTLQQWLQGLPRETLHRRPRLCIVSASLLATSSVRIEEIEPYLQMAEAQLLTTTDDVTSTQVQEMLGEIDGIRANLARRQGNFSRAIPLFEQALKRIPKENVFQRALICMNLGASLVYTGKIKAATPILIEAVEQGQRTGSLYILMQAFYRLSWMLTVQGSLHRSYAECQRALQFVDAATHLGDVMHAGVISITLGNILREWNDLDNAAQVLIKGIEGCEQSGELVLLGIGYLQLAHVRLEQGALDEAQTILQTVEHNLQHRRLTIPFHSAIPFYQVRLWLAQGELDAAMQWARDRHAELDSTLGHLYALECLTIARVLLVHGREGKDSANERSLEEALLMSKQTRLSAEADGRKSQVIDALKLMALILQAQGKTPQAVEMLKQAVTLAEPEGYIRLFVDEGSPMATLLRRAFADGVMPTYITTLLAALDAHESKQEQAQIPTSLPSHSSQSSLLDPLSEREMEVLLLIADGQSNDEIGQVLFVSMGTVKTHLKHIYSKLDVHTRTQAVARARELHLLSS